MTEAWGALVGPGSSELRVGWVREGSTDETEVLDVRARKERRVLFKIIIVPL